MGLAEISLANLSLLYLKKIWKIFYSSTHRLLKDRSDLLIDVLSGEDNRAYLINLEDDNVDLPAGT